MYVRVCVSVQKINKTHSFCSRQFKWKVHDIVSIHSMTIFFFRVSIITSQRSLFFFCSRKKWKNEYFYFVRFHKCAMCRYWDILFALSAINLDGNLFVSNEWNTFTHWQWDARSRTQNTIFLLYFRTQGEGLFIAFGATQHQFFLIRFILFVLWYNWCANSIQNWEFIFHFSFRAEKNVISFL